MVASRAFIAPAQVALIAVLSAVGTLGIKSAFVSWGFAPTVVLAAIIGAAVPFIAHKRAVAFPLSTAISLAALAIVGTILSYYAPWRLPDFVIDLVESWRRILTIAAPVDAQSSLIAVPIVLAWVGSTIGTEIALRTQRVGLPLIGPLIAAAGAILFGLNDNMISLWVGVAFLAIATIFFTVRSRTHWLWNTEKGATNRGRRLTVAALVVALAVAAAPTVTERIFNLSDNDRFTLRQEVDPPFDLTRLSSPLAELKGSLPTADMTENDDRGSLAFRISGDPIERIRLAVLDDYDGTIWLINRNADGADFIRAGTQFPPPDPINQGEVSDHSIEIVDLAESFLPTGGTAVGLEITSDVQIGGVEPVELIRLDRVTGNLIIRPRLRTVEGLSYNVASVAPIEATALAGQSSSTLQFLTSSRNVRVPEVPSSITALARDAFQGADDPFGRVAALQAVLADQVYDAEGTPGHLLIQLATLAEANPMVGFDEQYAALMATTLRASGIPARVAVGYVPAEDDLEALRSGAAVDVFETDIEAWVEVPFDGHGWVAFEAGPSDDQTDEIEDGVSEAQAESVSANPPPPVSSTTSTTIPSVEEDEEEPEVEEEESANVAVAVAIAAIVVGTPLILALGAIAIIVLMKRRRRGKRQQADSPALQIHGAFEEYVDRSLDAGTELQPGLTPRAAIERLSDESFDPLTRSGSLAILVEDAAFAPIEPSSDEAETAWEHSHELAERLGADMTRGERFKAAISLRSLRKRGLER